MNFTREPIIETIITPKDGNKLIVRNSNGSSQEEYSVDAVEVVSFGHSFFFRSSERPKCFLVPVGDYEVIETKETRVVLKNAPLEKSVKIGGGKQNRVVKEVEEDEVQTTQAEHPQHSSHDDKMKRRKGLRRRRGPEDRHEHREGAGPKLELIPPAPIVKDSLNTELTLAKSVATHEEPQAVSSTMFRSLFPPPTQLISENIHRYKTQEVPQENVFSDEVKKPPKVVDEHHQTKPHVEASSEEETKKNNPRYHQANHLDEHDEDPSHLRTPGLEVDDNFLI